MEKKKAAADERMGTSTSGHPRGHVVQPRGATEPFDLCGSTWERGVSSACQWNATLLMGLWLMCVNLFTSPVMPAHTLILWLAPSQVGVLYDAQ